jgi:hypothetical protein
MDRYDAILEHLKSARSRGLDTVTKHLDTAVESLEELIQSTKSTVQDALPLDAEETFPLSEIEAFIAEVREEKTPTAGISLENLRNLDRARSQSELLRALLPMLAEHVGRAVVLVFRDEVISAWSGIGFADGEELRSWHGGVAASPDFQQLVETTKPLSMKPASDPLISEWLAGKTIPDEAVLLPISLRGKLMGMVYIDHDGDDPWNVEAAQALNAVACWLIDTLHHRATVPTPTLAEVASSVSVPTDSEVAEVFEPPPELESTEPPPEPERFEPPQDQEVEEPAASEPEPESVQPPIEEPSFDAAPVDEIDFEPDVVEETDLSEEREDSIEMDYDFEPEPPPAEDEVAEADFDPSATMRVEVGENLATPEISPEPDVIPPPPPASEATVEPSAPAAEAKTTSPLPVQPVEPPSAAPEPAVDDAASTDRSPDEEASHDEARRFARLLVSEIKLYNEDEVERGRSDKDLGKRLKDDIERSREMFEKRIPTEVRDGHDYFHDELVRILADGDADALGM